MPLNKPSVKSGMEKNIATFAAPCLVIIRASVAPIAAFAGAFKRAFPPLLYARQLLRSRSGLPSRPVPIRHAVQLVTDDKPVHDKNVVNAFVAL